MNIRFSQSIVVALFFVLQMGTGQGQMVSVTWNLNMTNETVAAEGPSVAGGADFGFPGDNPMSDPDGDGIWTLTTEVASGYTGYYTFTNGACGDWSCKENIAGQDCANPANYNDRQLENITEDTVINTCFGQCSTDGSCEASSEVDVTFQVDMNNENTDGGVFMFGGFNGWNAGGNPLDDSDGDGIYTLTVNAQPGGFEWKYISGDGEETFDPAVSGECTLTSGEFTNRFIMVEGTENITLDVVCFNSCDACHSTYEITTVVDIIVNSEDHTLLEAAVGAAGLAEALSGDGPFTVFAPTDDAVTALVTELGITAEDLLALEGLGDILLYHVVGGTDLSTDLMDGDMFTTLLGEDITISIMDGTVMVNNATVTVADITTDNGVVHVIDAVMSHGCNDPEACNYSPIASWGTANCLYAFGCDFCSNGFVMDGDEDNDEVCDEDEVDGCTDSSAWNFNPEATEEDLAACVFVPGGCESIGNDNWNTVGLGVHPADIELMFGVEVEQELVLHVPQTLSDPDSGALFSVLNFTPTEVLGVPEGLNIGWTEPAISASTQACLPMTGTPLETGTFTVVWTGDMLVNLFGSPLPIGDFSFEQTLTVLPNPNPIPGCTYSGSSNFNPVANIDNGGCLFEGCMDPEADNHHPLFNLDDGSCVYGGLGPGDEICPANLNGDDLIGIADLLILLGEFGIICP